MTPIDIIPRPGLLTDHEIGLARCQWIRAHAYDWLSFQHYNPRDGGRKARDLEPAKAAGLNAGVWGVTYEVSEFHRDGMAMGSQAVTLGAQHLIVDAEECAKYTRQNRGMLPLIVGIREGGWNGPVHLCPLGAPVNALPHGGNDYQVDVESFLMTGGGVLPQAYVNGYANYRPSLCVDYWIAVDVPADRINVMIDLAPEAGNPRMSGAEWLPFLQEAGVKRNFSIYMEEFLIPYDLEGLDVLSQAAPTPEPTPEEPPVTNDAAARNDQVEKITGEWLANFGPASLSRMACEHDIAASTDSEWMAARGSVRLALSGVELVRKSDLDAAEAELAKANMDLASARSVLLAAEAKIAAAKQALS